MANDKITWQELRKIVAENANCSEQEAGMFLSALLDGIMVGLKEDKQVKIKGLGTFTLKAVAARKSVNIATGESFTIEGYNKLNFAADSTLKEFVEKRIETPQTKEVVNSIASDPIKKLSEQATEIVDILAELGQEVTKTSLEVEEVQESSGVLISPEGSNDYSPANVQEVQEVQVKEVATELAEVEPVAAPTCKPTCKCHKWVCWIIAGVLLLGGAGAGYYFSDVLIQCWEWVWSSQSVVIECTAEEGIEDGTEEVIVEIIEEPEIEIQPIEVEKETALANTLATLPREYVNFIATEEVGKNSRLAWIAYKYYEEKDLWVFIYEANRDLLSHPSRVRPGQKLRIPALDKRYRDLSNPELRQLVDSLAVEYLK